MLQISTSIVITYWLYSLDISTELYLFSGFGFEAGLLKYFIVALLIVFITNSVNITDDNGCVTTQSTVINLAPAITVTAGADQIICNGGIPNGLSATGSVLGTYLWTPNDFTDNTVANPVFSSTTSLTTTTTYTVTFTSDVGSCQATAAVTITVNPVPTVTLTALPTPACSGDNITLTATPSLLCRT